MEKAPSLRISVGSSYHHHHSSTTMFTKKNSTLSWTVLPLGFLLLAALTHTCQALDLGIPAEQTFANASVEMSAQTELKIGKSGTYSHAAVATDAGICSEIGLSMLKRGGSPVDAAISSILCVGVVNLHSTGIGGGGFMLYYQAASNQLFALDYREVAPLSATYNMGLSVAVPGELRGLEMAWKKWGRLRWQELFRPVIDLARHGFPISPAISKAIQYRKEFILSGKYPGLYELLAPNGKLLGENDTLRRPQYANTLEMIAWKGAGWFYDSEFMKVMVRELHEYRSILTEEDFTSYTAVKRRVTKSYYGGLVLNSISAPSSGAVLGLILNILDKYGFDSGDCYGGLSYHRAVEAFKFAYAQRLKLGDPAFNDTVDDTSRFMLDLNTAKEMFSRIEDDMTHNQDYYMWPSNIVGNEAHSHGTSHVSILASNGDAVAATGTINLYFGSLIRSKTSGIIFNNEMDDFSYPTRNNPDSYKQTEVNSIEPGKRPLSSMSPTILLDDDGNVRMVIGASGGFRITTAIAQVILNAIGFKKPLNESIALPRLHHQLFPNYILIERDFPSDIQAILKSKGHRLIVGTPESSAVLQGIITDDKGNIHATCDVRKGGSPAGY